MAPEPLQQDETDEDKYEFEDIDDLVTQIKDDAIPDYIDSGPPVGKEYW